MRAFLRSLAFLAVLGAVLTPVGAAADVPRAKRYIDSFHSEAGCRAAGRDGERKGHWTNPTCVKSIIDLLGTWDLWVD
ncbi:hypothetical protein [Nonomuraea sp. NPDC048916]|uniref:hypothetical protein n=1 Tax=Nonomuraea sp. NPDC048916 TaxID=3154232 RepID=UPI0033D924D4